jgi:predicted RND superfamily exporter protein/lauroyl/myristoyl acyltransferase
VNYLLSRFERLATRHPGWILIGSLVLTAVSLWAITGLTFSGDMTRFLPSQSPEVQRLNTALEQFEFADELYVFLEKEDAATSDQALTDFADRLGETLSSSDFFETVRWRLPDHAESYVRDVMMPNLPVFLGEEGFAEFLARLSPAAIESRVKRNMARLRRGAPQAEAKLIELDPLRLGFLLREVLESQKGSMDIDVASGYLMSGDHIGLLVIAQGADKAQNTDFSVQLMEKVHRLEQTVREAHPELENIRVSFAGGYAVAAEGQGTVRRDLTVTSTFSTIGVLALFFLVFRRIRAMHFVAIPLLLGLIWTLGFAAIAIGQLNIVSVVFAAMIAGLTIDFPIHLYSRYGHELRQGHAAETALRRTLAGTGPGVVTAAATTFVALSAVLFTRPPAFQELGLISGMGIVLCLLAMLTVLPALIVRFDRTPTPARMPLDLIAGSMTGLRIVTERFRVAILVLSAIAAFAAGWIMLSSGDGLQFESNLERLRILDEQTMPVQNRIVERFKGTFDPLLLVSTEQAESEAIERAWSNYRSLTSHLGGTLANIHGPFPYIVPGSVQEDRLSRLGELDLDEAAFAFESAARTAGFVWTDGYARYADWIRGFADLNIQSYARLDHPFISELRGRYFAGDNHTHVLQIAHPAMRLWERADRDRVLTELNAGLQENDAITGFTTILSHLEDTIKEDILRCTLGASGLIFFLVWMHFRNVRDWILALLPVLLGVLWTAAWMKAADIHLNHVNVMLFLLVIGIGVDNGIHIVHRSRERDASPEALFQVTGRAVFLTTVTTMLGFGALFFARHQLIHSLGEVILLALGIVLFASLVVLPAACLVFRAGSSPPEPVWCVLFNGLSATLPRAIVVRIARACTRCALPFLQSLRTTISDDLVRAGVPQTEAATRANGVILNYATYLVDYFYLARCRPETEERLFDPIPDGLLEPGQYIVVTPHVGNWELGILLLHRLNIPLTVGTAAAAGDPLERTRKRIRTATGTDTVHLDSELGLMGMLEPIRAGRSVALLFERPLPGAAISTEFLGRTAFLPLGPAGLARAADVPIVVIAIPLASTGRYTVDVEAIIHPNAEHASGDDRERMTLECARAVESLIRRYPDQWYNFGAGDTFVATP